MADFDAGRVFLQVVPSFRNVQRLIGAEARSWGRDAGREFQRGFDQETKRDRQPLGPSDTDSRKQGSDSGGAFADGFKRRVEAAMRSLPPVKIGPVESGTLDAKLRELRLQLERLSDKRIGVDVDTGTAMAELERIDDELDRLSRESADIQVRVDAGAARSQLAAIHAQVNDLDRDDVHITVDADTAGAGASLNTFSGRLLLLGTAGAALAPAIVPAAGAAAAALAGIGAGALVGVVGIGVLAIAFRGIGDALKAMGAAQTAAADDAVKAGNRQTSTASAVASAQRQLAQAEAGLANARANAADQAEASARRLVDAQAAVAEAEAEVGRRAEDVARRVEDARRAVVEATEDAATDVTTALRRQEDAEEALADAQENTRQAQLSLTRARMDAQAVLDDLALSTRSAALAEEDAELGLARARERLIEATAEGATGLDLREVELSVRQAELRFDEARDRNQEAQAAAQAAQQAGVDGAEAVLTAEERLADARDREADGQRRLQEAAAATTQARIDGAERIADAERQLGAAVLEQQRAQIDGIQRIADAQQRVTDAVAAQEQQQRQSAFALAGALASVEGAQAAVAAAAVSAGDVGSAAMNKLEEAMAALSPAGRAFATFLFGLKPVWDQIKSVVQEGLLPGVQGGLQAMLPMLPSLLGFLGDMAGVLGQLAREAGEAFASPAWRPFFDYLASEGPGILLRLGRAFGDIALGIADLMVVFAPLTDLFIGGIGNMAQSFVNWTSTLAENEGFQTFLRFIGDSIPVVLEFLESLGGAFVAIIKSMAPFGPVILKIVTGLLNFVAALPPGVLSALVLGFIGFTTVMTVLAPIITAVGTFMAALAGGATILGAVVAALGGPITLIVLGLVLLGAALVAAYGHSETFRNIVQAVWQGVQDVISFAWEKVIRPVFEALSDFVTETLMPVLTDLWRDVVRPAFEGISEIISWAWDHVIEPLLKAWVFYITEVLAPTVSWLWNNIIEPAFSGISQIIEIVWGIVEIIFKAWVFMIEHTLGPIFTWLWKEIIKPAFDGIGSLVTAAWETVVRPVFEALGGFIENTVVPAFQRGVDTLKAIWDTLKGIFAAPINFVIETIYNDGIRRVFNTIAGVVGADRLPEMEPIRFAKGGILPGFTPGRDVHRFFSPTGGLLELSGGEPILRPEAGRVLGKGWVNGINTAAMSGGVGGVQRFLGGRESGGPIGDLFEGAKDVVGGVVGAVRDFVVGGLRKAAELALIPVRALLDQLGDSYFAELLKGLANRAIDGLLGFAGRKDDDATDLGSVPLGGGLFSALIDFLRGTGVPFAVTSTQRDGDPGMHGRGKAADFSVAGHGNRGYGDPGLRRIFEAFLPAAANLYELILAGAPFNIKRGQQVPGYAWGQPGQPGNHWNHVHGAVFDEGGWLLPGIHNIANYTGQPEAILTASQWADLRQSSGRGVGDIDARVQVAGNVYGVDDLDGWANRRDAQLRHELRQAAAIR